MNLTLAITTHNRPSMTIKAFEKVLEDKRIDEILIVDDHSEEANYEKLIDLCKDLSNGKIRIVRNEENKGCYHNKREAVSLAKNEWVIIFDSDNVIDRSYLDALEKYRLDNNTIYAPDFAKPHFDYTEFSNIVIDKLNVSSLMSRKGFDCLINTCNYVVNKSAYLREWKNHKEPWTADTLFMNYNWLIAGNKIQIVGDMRS